MFRYDVGISTIVTVNNVAPVITGLSVDSAVINENGSVTVSGTFTDVGTQDTHTVLINWGNGEVSSAALVVQGNGSGRFSATHQYLVGNGDEDILIAGWTDYDAFLPSTNYAPLWSLMAEWNRSTDQATRRSNITAGVGLNGAYRLSASAIPLAIPLAATVHDDNDQDKLTGSSGIDWFFANLSGGAFLDVITDKSVNELLQELT